MKLIICFLVTLLVSLAFAQDPKLSGYVSIDFAAAAPYTYDHSVGGGAWNDKSIGSSLDVVESLQGGELACGDSVSFFQQIKISPNAPQAIDVEVRLEFLADVTGGAPGVAFSNVHEIEANDGQVENGVPGGTFGSSAAGGGEGVYGVDTGVNLNGDEVVTLDYKGMTSPIFTKGAILKTTYTATNLDPGEVMIVRLDVELACIPNSSPTGNLGASIASASVVNFNTPQSISVGKQSVPLKDVGAIQGITDCYFASATPPLTGVSFSADVEVTSGDAATTGAIDSTFAYSWEYGAWVIDAKYSDAVELHTFETTCTNDHDGEYLFASGSCATGQQCEETFIGSNQAQFFHELPDYETYPNAETYYDPNYTVETLTIYGQQIEVRKYVANPDYWVQQSVSTLYVTNDASETIVRAVLYDGRVMTFSNVQYVATPDSTFIALFDEPEGCVCRRPIDMIIAVDAADMTKATLTTLLPPYITNFVSNFDLENTVNVGLYEYDDVVTKLLTVAQGTSEAAIASGIGRLGESCSASVPCGTGFGDVALAISTATAELSPLTRGERVIVVITNGWDSAIDASVEAAVTDAAAAGITVIAITHYSVLLPDQMTAITNGNPDNLIWYWRTEDLVASDPIAIASRLCLLSSTPCGTACCGYCDTACGECLPLDTCPDSGDCNNNYQPTADGCCELVTGDPYCAQPDTLGPCEEMVCQIDGSCALTTCADLDTPCSVHECVNNECVARRPNQSTTCNLYRCENEGTAEEAWVGPTPLACPASTNCATVTCVEGQGCVSTPRSPPPVSSAGPCTYLPPCDPNGSGWEYVPIECTSDDLCVTSVCDPDLGVNGECVTSPKCVPNSGDLCSLNQCDPANGNCLGNSKTCPDVGCDVNGACNPDSGQCEYSGTKSCPALDDDAPGSPHTECRLQACVRGNVNDCQVVSDNCPCLPEEPDCFSCPDCTSSPCVSRVCTDDSTCVATDFPCPSDECNINPTCAETTGSPVCSTTPVVCDTSLLGPCEYYTRDPTYPGCCVINNRCDANLGDCHRYQCNVNTDVCERVPTDSFICAGSEFTNDCLIGQCNSTGFCVSVPRKADQCAEPTDACMVAECDLDGNCVQSPVVCDHPDHCSVASCVDGMCVSVARDCANGDLCLVAPCDVSAADRASACPATPASKTCNGCDLCESTTGVCQPNDCSDDIACTSDACTDSQCVNTPVHSRCASADPCKVKTCEPSNPNADAQGCVTVVPVCQDEDFCTMDTCVAFTGCVSDSRDCRSNPNDTVVATSPSPSNSNTPSEPAPVIGVDDCNLHYCDSAENKCFIEEKACVPPAADAGLIIGAALGSAAVIGIVVGIVVAVALCAGGAGVYSVYKNVDDGADAVVANNPLYEQAGAAQENPLFSV